MSLPILPPDKANHFVYGSLAGCLGALAAPLVGMSPALGAIVAAAVAGVAKEIRDRATGRGNPESLDAIATAAGALPVALALWGVA